MMNILLIKQTSCFMKCQFYHVIMKFVKDFLYYLESYDIYTFRQIIIMWFIIIWWLLAD